MDITLALQRAVRNFAHGSAALAARLGMSVHTLNHKVSPTYSSAECSVEEAAEICEVTGDMGPLHAFAARLQHVAMPAALGVDVGDQAAHQLAETVREFGEFVSATATAVADGRVSRNELATVERDGAEAIAAINALVQIARRVHETGRTLRAVDGAANKGAGHGAAGS